MSILDDAIREHLELKRAHGADEAELKKLEDEAFGPAPRPEEVDPFAEAPTEFMATEAAEGSPAPEGAAGRRINVADLQEPPPPPPSQEEGPRIERAAAIEPEADAPVAPAEDAAQAAPPAEEPLLAADAEPAPEETAPAPEDAAPAPEETAPAPEAERQSVVEQPTELFDVEAELGAEPPAPESPSPSDEDLIEAELSEPRVAPAEPPTEIHASRAEPPPAAEPPPSDEDEEDEEFWSEQRLSDELDQALEAPAEPHPEEHSRPAGEAERAPVDYDPDTGHEDVLEDTPEFLENAPEDDELWFEQKPPKDFDFDD